MRLSFVIPAYNEEACIGKCLSSVLKEKERSGFDVEVIVVNNNSTDRTKDVALSFLSVRIVDEPQKGIVKARQAGYLAATGDLIANVDADNILPEGWIEQVFEEFSRNSNLAALSGPLVYYDLSWIVNVQIKLFSSFPSLFLSIAQEEDWQRKVSLLRAVDMRSTTSGRSVSKGPLPKHQRI